MKNFSILFIAIFFGILFSSITYALMPPEHYIKKAKDSKIKAIAIVKSIKKTSHSKGITTKEITFSLVKSFQKNTPSEFKGICKSFEPQFWERKEPLLGGNIYYYPKNGEKVFVSILQDKGDITIYTKLNPEVEDELNKNGLKNIDFLMNDIRIKSADMELFNE